MLWRCCRIVTTGPLWCWERYGTVWLTGMSPKLLQACAGKRVLLVEDEEDMSVLLTYQMERLGFETVSAGDGKAGLRKALEGEFDLIILDLMLPILSGLEVCRQLNVRQGELRSPVIAITAVSPPIILRLQQKLGITQVIFKPFRCEALVAAALKAVGRSSELI